MFNQGGALEGNLIEQFNIMEQLNDVGPRKADRFKQHNIFDVMTHLSV